MTTPASSKARFPLEFLPFIVGPLVCGIVTWLSLPHGLFVTGGDSFTPELNPSVAFHRYVDAWNAGAGLGRDDSLYRAVLFPLVLVDLAGRSLGLSALALNHGWLIFDAVSQSFLTLLLFRTLFPSVKFFPALLFASFANFFNPLTLISWRMPYPTTMLSIAIFPGVLALAVRYCDRPRVGTLIALALAVAVCAVGNVNQAIIIVETALFTVTLVLLAFSKPKTSGRTRNVTQIALVYFGIGCAWWVGSAHALFSSLARLVAGSQVYSYETMLSTSQYSGLPNSLRLIGQYLFFNVHGSQLFLPEGPAYNTNAVLILASCVLPALALSAFLQFRRYGIRVVAVLAIVLGALFFAKGAAWPGGVIFAWLFDHVIVFHAFRESFDKFEWVVALGYAVLAPLALVSMSRLHVWGWVLIAFAFVALGIGAHPMLNRHMFWHRTKTQFPARYAEAATWLAQHPPGRLLLLPVVPNLWEIHSWGYTGPGVFPNLTEDPVVGALYDYEVPGAEGIDNAFRSASTSVGTRQAARLAGLFGIRYMVFDPTVNLNYFAGVYTLEDPRSLEGIRLARSWPQGLQLFTVDGAMVNGSVYAASSVIVGARDVDELGAACRVLRSCRFAVAVPDEIRAAMSGRADTIVAVGSSNATRAKHGASYWSRPGFFWPQRTAAKSRSGDQIILDGAALGVGGRGTSVWDFGNMSVAESKNAHARTYDAHGPVQMRIIDATQPGQPRATFRSLVRFDRESRVCPGRYESMQRELPVPVDWVGEDTGLLLLRYGHMSGDARLAVRLSAIGKGDNEVQTFFAVLKTESGTTYFSRLFAWPLGYQSLTATLTVDGGQRGGCTTFSNVVVARSLQKRTGQVLKDIRKALFATPPYFSERADVLAHAKNQIVPIRGGSRPPRTRAPRLISDVSPRWSDAESVDGPVQLFLPNGAARSGGFRVLRSGRSIIDVHAEFMHLLPGAAYKIAFPVQHLSGPRSRLVVLDGTGKVLGHDVLPPTELRTESLEFVLPPNSTTVHAYLYVGSIGFAEGRERLGDPVLSFANGAPLTIGVRKMRPPQWRPPVVKTVAHGNTYDVTIEHAPQRYTLVLNSTYNAGWNLSTPPGVSAKHFHANLYENGWLVDGAGSYKLRITYSGRTYVLVGLAVCFVALVLAFGLCWLEPRIIFTSRVGKPVEIPP